MVIGSERLFRIEHKLDVVRLHLRRLPTRSDNQTTSHSNRLDGFGPRAVPIPSL